MKHHYKKTLLNSAVLLALSAAPAAWAVEGDAVGSPIQVNTQTSGDQVAGGPSGGVAMNANGDFVVTWTDRYGYDGSSFGVFMRRFSADGTPLDSSDRLVNITTNQVQMAQRVASSPDGRFVVLYLEESSGDPVVRARLYDADGNSVDDFQVNDGETTAVDADVAMATDGSFVVTWQSDVVGGEILARRYSADGTALDATPVTINTTSVAMMQEARIAMDVEGNYIIVWGMVDSAYNTDVRARRYSADGTAIDASDYIVNTTTGGVQGDPDVAMNAAGNYVVTWRGSDGVGSGYGIYAKCYAAAGSVARDEFAVLREADLANASLDIPHVAMDAEGDFAISAADFGYSDGNGYAAYMKRYNSSCTELTADPVNVGGPSGSDLAGAIAMDADGDMVVVYTNTDGDDGDGGGVFAQRFEGVGHTVDLAIVGVGDSDTLGGSLTYTFTVTNSGSGTALGLNLKDVLPTGVSYSSFSSMDDWSCSDGSGKVTCTLPSMASGASSSVDITVDTSGVTASGIENTANITNGVTDANNTDNSTTVTTGVTASSGSDNSGSSGGGGGAFGWLGLLFGLLQLWRYRFTRFS